MKKSIIFIFLVLAILKAHAQDYLISFSGTGDTTIVSNVTVNNLTSGASLTLNGGDILHLTNSILGISDITKEYFKIYPNPMTEQSIITIFAPEIGHAAISIVDLSGKTISRITSLLSFGANSFRISGINQSMYFVKVTGKNFNYSSKLISQNSEPGEVRIEYVSSTLESTNKYLKSTSSTIDMLYSSGDRLLYKGVSGNYSTVVTDIPVNSKMITFNFVKCKDSDNKNYPIVQIDSQIWMAENLNVGTRIDCSQNQNPTNDTIEKHCIGDQESNCDIYGGLYQWNEAMQGSITEGTQGICPSGWHVPTKSDWDALIIYSGGIDFAGGKLKENGTSHWISPNTGATNETGFTALPGGCRENETVNGALGSYTGFWTSTSGEGGQWPTKVIMYYTGEYAIPNGTILSNSFSLRCIKD